MHTFFKLEKYRKIIDKKQLSDSKRQLPINLRLRKWQSWKDGENVYGL